MKIFFEFILFLCLFSFQINGQSLVELDELILNQHNKLDTATNELKRLDSDNPKFKIYGEIKERSNTFNMISVWGIAIPIGGDYFLDGTLSEESNIIITNPDKQKIGYSYYSEGEHYFIGKTYGKNAFGADVPIYNYGVNTFAEEKILALKKEIRNIEEEIIYLKEQKRLLLIETFFTEGDRLFSEGDYKASIIKYQSAFDIDNSNYEKYNKIIAEAYYLWGNEYFNINDFKTAIINYDKAYNHYSKEEYLIKKFESYKNIGDNYLTQSNFSEAINNYEKAISTYSKRNGEIFPSLALAYFNLAKTNMHNNENIIASENFKWSYKTDTNLKYEIEPILSSIRKSPFLYATYSLIPGLGQILQGKSNKGLIQLSLFSASTIGIFVLNSTSKDSYKKYEQAITSEDAEILYSEANSQKMFSYLAIGVSAGIIIWSVIDSFIEAKEFNEPFYLSYNFTTQTKSHNLSISLSIR